MDIPDLVRQSLGDEEIQAGVSLGDEDAVCLTPTRTLVYHGESLLSDEEVESYSHDIEQLAISEGRRKTKFTMQYIEGTESFTVPANRGKKVLKLFLEAVLRLEGVIDQRESLAGVYRFSELALIIAESRVVKHIGNQVWTEDYEVYPYEDVTELSFERASVATSIALTVDSRPQRIKVPNDQARVVRQTVEQALFDYYDVSSLDDLNRVIATEQAPGTDETDATSETGESDDGFTFGDDFDPLVSDDEEDLTESVDAHDQLAPDQPSADASQTQPGGSTGKEPSRGAESQPTQQPEQSSGQQPSQQPTQQPDQQSNQPGSERGDSQQPPAETEATGTDSQTPSDSTHTDQTTTEPGLAEDGETVPVSREEYEAMAERLDELTEAVDRQNELLKRQHRALKQLVKQQNESK